MPSLQDYDLRVDLTAGVVPISKASSALAALIRQTARDRRPVVITQKGAPAAVLVDVELYQLLVNLAKRRMPA